MGHHRATRSVSVCGFLPGEAQVGDLWLLRHGPWGPTLPVVGLSRTKTGFCV